MRNDRTRGTRSMTYRHKNRYQRPLRGQELLEERLALSGSPWGSSSDSIIASNENGLNAVRGADKVRSGEILVGFEGEVAQSFRTHGLETAMQKAGEHLSAAGLHSGRVLTHVGAGHGFSERLVTHWKLPGGLTVADAVQRVQGSAGVAYAEPNGLLYADALIVPSDPGLDVTPPAGWNFGLQEHIGQMNAVDAWNHGSNPQGDGIVVAVIDTGVDLNHPDLDDNLHKDGGGNVIGASFVSGNDEPGSRGNAKGGNPGKPGGGGGSGGGLPQDDNFHGTHVAGIIAAELNNMSEEADEAPAGADWEGGTVGVAPLAKIMPVKVLDSGGSGSFDAVAEGIAFATDPNGDGDTSDHANIINMSLGGGFSQAVSDAIRAAYNAGALVIASAGNSNRDSSGHPASDPFSLSISAVDAADQRASFSNYGFSADVAAPGVSILSTVIDGDAGERTGSYDRVSGTSMASPNAAGVAALIASANSTWTVDEIAGHLLATSQPIDTLNPGFEGQLGAGRIDALAAVSSAANPTVIALGGVGAMPGTLSLPSKIDRLEVGDVITVRFSHAMNTSDPTDGVLNIGNYTLTDAYGASVVLDMVTELPNDPTAEGLSDADELYFAFPGRGVKLDVLGLGVAGSSLPDGLYHLHVGGTTANGVAVSFDHYFEIVPRVLNLEAVAPLGSMIYAAAANEQFETDDDIDNFVVNLEAGMQLSVEVTSDSGATIEVTRPGGTSEPISSADQIVDVGGEAGDYVIAVEANAAESYTLRAILNATGETHSPDSAPQLLSPTTIAGVNRAAVFGQIASFTFDTMLEDFENGLNGYHEKGKTKASIYTATSLPDDRVMEGSSSLQDETNNGLKGWLIDEDLAVVPGTDIQQGQAISGWIRSQDEASGRAYLGFGASGSSALSIVMAPNTRTLEIQRHDGYGYETLASVSQTWQADRWYRFEVDWRVGGDLVGRLYDSDGTTLLNELTGHDDSITGGGLAFRGFQATKYFDQVERASAAPSGNYYELNLSIGEAARIYLTEISGGSVQLEYDSGSGWQPASTGPSNVDQWIDVSGAGPHRIRVTGNASAQYTLLASTDAVFDEENMNDDSSLAQTLSVDPATNEAKAFGHVGSALVGYFTDNSSATTSPESSIRAAGLTPLLITDVSTFDFNSIDVLMVNEASNSGPSPELDARLPDIELWVHQGGIFIVHDRFVGSTEGQATSNPFLVGTSGSSVLVTRDFTNGDDIDVVDAVANSAPLPAIETSVSDGTGPGGPLLDTDLDGGNSSSHGFADLSTLPTDGSATAILSAGPAPDQVAGFVYQVGGGHVYYSTIPLDYYLRGGGPGDVQQAMAAIYTPNLLAYANNLRPEPFDVDWYSVNAGVGTSISVSLGLPGEGAGEFDNTLDPLTPVNTTETSPGTWLIRVEASATTPPTSGEYVLTVSVIPAPLSAFAAALTESTTVQPADESLSTAATNRLSSQHSSRRVARGISRQSQSLSVGAQPSPTSSKDRSHGPAQEDIFSDARSLDSVLMDDRFSIAQLEERLRV